MTSEQMRSPRRIAVIGTSGSGKTTFARRVAAAIDAPHFELDGFFHQPNWVPAEPDVFRARVSDAVAGPAWVTDGNYTSFLRDIVWPAANTIVWLDYPFRIVIWRLFGRTMRRAATREVLWNGNRESLRQHFFTNQSLFLWAKNTHWKHRREWIPHLESPAMSHVRVVHLRSPKAAEAWLRELEIAAKS